MDSEILETVRVYAEALSRGDFARAASCIDPQDRVDFQRELLASLALLEEVGFDYGIRAQFQNQPVEALSRLSAEEFLALFLAQSVTAAGDLKMEVVGGREVDDCHALVTYQVAQFKNEMEMRRAAYGWKVRLRQGISKAADQLRELASDYQLRARADRIVPPEVGLHPFALFGYQDEHGQTVIEPRFQQAREFCEGLAAVQVMHRWGFIDHSGRLRIPVRYLDVTSFGDGRAWVADVNENFDKRWALIDRTGQLLTPFDFRQVECFREGLAAARGPKLWGYVNSQGEWVIQPAFSEAGPFLEGSAWVEHPRDGVYQIDPQGRKVAGL